MNNVYNEPKYDTDPANKGYVDSQSQHIINVINGVEEDTNNKLNRKTQNFGSQPTPPYRVNDTWMNGTDIYICINERLIGNFVASDWKKASTYDNTKSILDGGITTNGTLVVAKGGTVAAGLTAYTEGDNGVRLWAGSNINGINSAPFRVLQNGSVFMTKANITGGNIKLHSSNIDNIMFKAYLDGYENNVYAAIYTSTVSLRNNNNYCSMGFGTGQPTVSASRDISSTENHAAQMCSDFIWVIKTIGSTQVLTQIKAEEIETPKITAGNIDCGTCTLSNTADSVIPFNKTFTTNPIVVLTPHTNNTPSARCYSGCVVSSSTTDFKAYCLSNSSTAVSIDFNWIAIGN